MAQEESLNYNQELFEYLSETFGITALGSEMDSIIEIVMRNHLVGTVCKVCFDYNSFVKASDRCSSCGEVIDKRMRKNG